MEVYWVAPSPTYKCTTVSMSTCAIPFGCCPQCSMPTRTTRIVKRYFVLRNRKTAITSTWTHRFLQPSHSQQNACNERWRWYHRGDYCSITSEICTAHIHDVQYCTTVNVRLMIIDISYLVYTYDIYCISSQLMIHIISSLHDIYRICSVSCQHLIGYTQYYSF